MASKNLLRTNEEGVYSHIYNKGIENKVIFNDKQDCETFLGYLKDYLTPPQAHENIKEPFILHGRVYHGVPHQPKNYLNKVELVAYNVMPDHFHLVLHQLVRGSMEGLIRSLCTRYSIYFNKKYKRTGSLFAGPYKSIKINSEHDLLHLTRFLHHCAGNSSYTAYMSEKETSWVKSQYVMSLIKVGNGNYKDFVENYEPNEKEKEIITALAFESEEKHLEKRELPNNVINDIPGQISNGSSENIIQYTHMRPHQRIPELITTGLVFIMLFTIGSRNILKTSAKSPKPIILGTNTIIAPTISPKPTALVTNTIDTATISASLSPTPSISPTTMVTEEIQPKIMVTIKISDGSASVNIRTEPNSSSDKIVDAVDGDSFEVVSTVEGWYEVKLASGSTGFISAKYIAITEKYK